MKQYYNKNLFFLLAVAAYVKICAIASADDPVNWVYHYEQDSPNFYEDAGDTWWYMETVAGQVTAQAGEDNVVFINGTGDSPVDFSEHQKIEITHSKPDSGISILTITPSETPNRGTFTLETNIYGPVIEQETITGYYIWYKTTLFDGTLALYNDGESADLDLLASLYLNYTDMENGSLTGTSSVVSEDTNQVDAIEAQFAYVED